MKLFSCDCGQPLYFENYRCLACGRSVGYDPAIGRMAPVDDVHYRRCRNGEQYGTCNWLVRADQPDALCSSCSITHITPNLSSQQNIRRWGILESAKRRLLYSLFAFDLPTAADPANGHPALTFRFLEDRGSNPLVAEDYVRTGHATGVITVNVVEADDVQREITRSLMQESYRTPLGHCRHESGHYFYDRIVRGSGLEPHFSALFGDPTANYEAALSAYYANPPDHQPQSGYITLYAQSHPLEDWAECWAHYLHIQDTLETASHAGIVEPLDNERETDGWIFEWLSLSVVLNELNRSMGLADAYPFVLTAPIMEKLQFMHSVVYHRTPS